jgi:uncharacterized membrane protein YbaN (DUF454 family)
MLPARMSHFVRYLWNTAGTLSVGLGVVGIVVPMMPATPFLLLAAYCYARGSKRFHDWLVGHPLLGAYIRAYREGRGLDRRQKALILVMLWASFGATMLYFVKPWGLRAILAAIAIGVTIHIVRMRGAAAAVAAVGTPVPGPVPPPNPEGGS